jgi:hypothetical protein
MWGKMFQQGVFSVWRPGWRGLASARSSISRVENGRALWNVGWIEQSGLEQTGMGG